MENVDFPSKVIWKSYAHPKLGFFDGEATWSRI